MSSSSTLRLVCGRQPASTASVPPRSSSSWARSANDDPSIHCASSSTSVTGRSNDRNAEVIRPKNRRRSTQPSSSRSRWPASNGKRSGPSASRNGSNAPPDSVHLPTSTRSPESALRPASSASSRVLPIPGSPTTTKSGATPDTRPRAIVATPAAEFTLAPGEKARPTSRQPAGGLVVEVLHHRVVEVVGGRGAPESNAALPHRVELQVVGRAEQHPDRRRAHDRVRRGPTDQHGRLVGELLHRRSVPSPEITGVECHSPTVLGREVEGRSGGVVARGNATALHDGGSDTAAT